MSASTTRVAFLYALNHRTKKDKTNCTIPIQGDLCGKSIFMPSFDNCQQLAPTSKSSSMSEYKCPIRFNILVLDRKIVLAIIKLYPHVSTIDVTITRNTALFVYRSIICKRYYIGLCNTIARLKRKALPLICRDLIN